MPRVHRYAKSTEKRKGKKFHIKTKNKNNFFTFQVKPLGQRLLDQLYNLGYGNSEKIDNKLFYNMRNVGLIYTNNSGTQEKTVVDSINPKHKENLSNHQKIKLIEYLKNRRRAKRKASQKIIKKM